jgi:hypothetical protein
MIEAGSFPDIVADVKVPTEEVTDVKDAKKNRYQKNTSGLHSY